MPKKDHSAFQGIPARPRLKAGVGRDDGLKRTPRLLQISFPHPQNTRISRTKPYKARNFYELETIITNVKNQHIFFNLPMDISAVARVVFQSLGIDNPEQRDSLNCGGEYYKALAFENCVTLEVNLYDWEDEYNYMISVGSDVLSKTQPSIDQIRSATDQISKLLQQNLKTRIAIEVNGELTIHEPN